jgi:hypothetical protein
MGKSLIIALDPGNTTGVAEFSSEGKLLAMHQLDIPHLYDYLVELEETPPEVIIYEEYVIMNHKIDAHRFSKVPTIQVIGAIVYAGHKMKCKVVEQRREAKTLGYKYANMLQPKDHKKSHGPDAVAHGYYYLINHKIVKPQVR